MKPVEVHLAARIDPAAARRLCEILFQRQVPSAPSNESEVEEEADAKAAR